MRTTLTIDDDLAENLKESARRSGRAFKQVVNETIRRGLEAEHAAPEARRYRVKPTSLGGVLPGVDLDHALRLADALEDEAIIQKLERRK